MMKLKVYVFTYRPSPTLDTVENKEAFRVWQDAALKAYKNLNGTTKKILELTHDNHRINKYFTAITDKTVLLRIKLQDDRFIGRLLGMHPVDIVTKEWLQKNNIEYNKLTIEKGSEDVADPRGTLEIVSELANRKKFASLWKMTLKKQSN